jgi:hypothetical protein
MARRTRSKWFSGATGLTLICLCGSNLVFAEYGCSLRERLISLLAGDTNTQACNLGGRSSLSLNTADTYLDNKMSDRSFREAIATSEADRQTVLSSPKNTPDAKMIVPNAQQSKQPISLPTLEGFSTIHK